LCLYPNFSKVATPPITCLCAVVSAEIVQEMILNCAARSNLFCQKAFAKLGTLKLLARPPYYLPFNFSNLCVCRNSDLSVSTTSAYLELLEALKTSKAGVTLKIKPTFGVSN